MRSGGHANVSLQHLSEPHCIATPCPPLYPRSVRSSFSGRQRRWSRRRSAKGKRSAGGKKRMPPRTVQHASASPPTPCPRSAPTKRGPAGLAPSRHSVAHIAAEICICGVPWQYPASESPAGLPLGINHGEAHRGMGTIRFRVSKGAHPPFAFNCADRISFLPERSGVGKPAIGALGMLPDLLR